MLALASGLIGGAALGCGMVLFFAIISDRLRRRSDIAAALEVPVPVSVGRIYQQPKRYAVAAEMRAWTTACRTRQRLAQSDRDGASSTRHEGRIGVICIDNAQEVRFAVARAATELADDGLSVSIVDLTRHGSLDLDLVPTTMGSTHRPTVLRPRGIPVLAGTMADLQVVGDDDRNPPSLDLTDVSLVFTDLDPSVGADYLVPWTDRVMIAVTAGRSSAEMVRTAADLIRTAGLELRIAGLLHTERTDKSSGTAGFEPIPIDVWDGHERTDLLKISVDESRAADVEHAAAMGVVAQDGIAAAHELTANAEQATHEESLAKQLEQERVDEELVPQPEEPGDEEALRAGPEQDVVDEEALTEQVEDQEPPQPEQHLVDEEALTEQPRRPRAAPTRATPGRRRSTHRTTRRPRAAPTRATPGRRRSTHRTTTRKKTKSRPPPNQSNTWSTKKPSPNNHKKEDQEPPTTQPEQHLIDEEALRQREDQDRPEPEQHLVDEEYLPDRLEDQEPPTTQPEQHLVDE